MKRLAPMGASFALGAALAVAGPEETLSPVTAVPAGKIVVDGDAAEWDWTGSQTAYVAAEFFEKERGEFVFAYDNEALYVAVRAADASPLRNVYHAAERFWEGDSIELRLYTNLKDHRAVPARTQKSLNSQVAHLTFFRQHTSGTVWTFLARGADFYESKINPDGVEAAFRESAGPAGYTLEARISWTVVNTSAPQPGDGMRVLVGFNFGNAAGNKRQRMATGAYLANPGDFGFLKTDCWGFLRFAGAPLKTREWPSAGELLASLQAGPTGAPIALSLPHPGQVTVNLYDPKTGRLVRELVEDRARPAGPHTMTWDGLDNAGQEAPLGDYAYRALVHAPIVARYLGSVGSSGTPPYQNDAGTGEWGGDHSAPLAVAIDAKGMTLLWPVAEQGKAIVRLDPQDRTVWRYTPFFDAAGNFYALAGDGDYVYLTYETPLTPPSVLRLSAATGEPMFFAKDAKSVPLPLSSTNRLATPPDSRPINFDLIATGMAADKQNLYIAIFPANEILVLNKADASLRKRLSAPGPRGLAVERDGGLLATCYAEGTGRVCRVSVDDGTCRDVVANGLSAPWAVAARANGEVLVTDLGASRQVKAFAGDGRLVRAYGRAGGRPYSGGYRAGNYLKPAGIAADREGGFVVTEAAIPSVITRIGPDDAIARQWFGPLAYSTVVCADPEDPFTIYACAGSEDGLVRGALDPKSGAWRLDAYWAISDSHHVRTGAPDLSPHTFGDPAFHRFTDGITIPQAVRLDGATYLSSDAPQHPIVRVEGDRLIPVAVAESREGRIRVGQDGNGDGRVAEEEWEVVPDIAIPPETTRSAQGALNGHVGSHTLSPYSGNWYLAAGRTIYRIPRDAAAKDRLRFAVAEARVFIADVTEAYEGAFHSSHRWGILGMREDAAGNLFVLYTYQGKSPGIGHSSDITRAFVARFDSQGRRVWTAGRKAAGFAKPGEMYNPWALVGLLNGKAVAISDEAGGVIHFYSTDGFYLGRIFDDVARGDGRPGPQLFNGENFSGYVQEYPEQNEYRYMAYMGETDARTFALEGVDAPRQELRGTVTLERHYTSRSTGADTVTLPRASVAPATDGALTGWEPAEPFAIRVGDKQVADVRLALHGEDLHFRFAVKDSSPLANAEPDPKIAFKGGDAVDLYLGPSGDRKAPVLGDVRLLIGLHNGQATLVGMKPLTDGARNPQTYGNPSGYGRTFDSVGPVEGAEVTAAKTADGYTVAGRVPLAFLKPLSFAPGTELRFDADVLGSDPAGQRTVTRTFWHAAGDSALTMTQDLPTEAWLYPFYWGKAAVK